MELRWIREYRNLFSWQSFLLYLRGFFVSLFQRERDFGKENVADLALGGNEWYRYGGV